MLNFPDVCEVERGKVEESWRPNWICEWINKNGLRPFSRVYIQILLQDAPWRPTIPTCSPFYLFNICHSTVNSFSFVNIIFVDVSSFCYFFYVAFSPKSILTINVNIKRKQIYEIPFSPVKSGIVCQLHVVTSLKAISYNTILILQGVPWYSQLTSGYSTLI